MSTPLPWKLQPCGNGGALLIRGEGAGKHAQFSLQIVPKEDAELIVRAVNCHEELLAALKAVLDTCAHNESADCPSCALGYAAILRAEKGDGR